MKAEALAEKRRRPVQRLPLSTTFVQNGLALPIHVGNTHTGVRYWTSVEENCIGKVIRRNDLIRFGKFLEATPDTKAASDPKYLVVPDSC